MSDTPTPELSCAPDPFAVLAATPAPALDPLALSPLASVTPDTLTALFEADPSTLPDNELDVLILDLRRRRLAFASEEAAKTAAGKKVKARPPTDGDGNRLPTTIADASLKDTPASEITLDLLMGPV